MNFSKEKQKLEAQVEQLKRENDDLKKKLEPGMVQNVHIRELLKQTEQGRILLELEQVAPAAMKIDVLAQRLNAASVIVKTAVQAMQEMGIVKFHARKREVRLTID